MVRRGDRDRPAAAAPGREGAVRCIDKVTTATTDGLTDGQYNAQRHTVDGHTVEREYKRRTWDGGKGVAGGRQMDGEKSNREGIEQENVSQV